MPCGGIYPIERNTLANEFRLAGVSCFHCGTSGVTHIVEEWDAFIHADCIDEFLKTPEGQIIIEHGHEVIR